MLKIITVGLDLAKKLFQAHGADVSGRAVLPKKLRRDQVLGSFSQLQPASLQWKPAAARIPGAARLVFKSRAEPIAGMIVKAKGV